MSKEEFKQKACIRPCYIDQEQAREHLAGMGVELTARQMKRATEMDAEGQRKLPFFVDPIDGRLKIEKSTLTKMYLRRQVKAERNCRYDFS